MSLLGIDFGLKRVGVALSQGDLAEPIGTFTADTQAKRLTLLQRLINEHAVDTIVIGTTQGSIKNLIDAFIVALKKVFNGTIVVREEAMTTVDAQQRLINLGTSQSKRQKNLDAYAATIILQGYLNEQHA